MDYFEKKQWIRIGVCAVLVIATVLAVTGVFSGNGPVKYIPPVSAETTEKGFGGEITVHATLEGKKVTSLAIDTPDETEGLGKRVSDAEFTDQFIGREGPFVFGENGIEAITGATVTSTAALKAINRTITGEEAEAEPEEAATEPPAEQPEDDTPEISMTEQGFAGDVTAHVKLGEDGTVKSLTIDTPDETEGLGKRASEAAFTDQFVGKAGPFTFGENGIDALSGATVTSNAALKAINRAVSGEEAEAKPEETGTEAPAEQPEDDTPEISMTEQGFAGDVTAHVKLGEDGTVKSLTIDTPDETEGLGKRASEAAFTDQFIGKTGPFTFGENGIDALSGATVTSNAALKAINRAVSGDSAEEKQPEEKKPETTEAPAEQTEERSGTDGLAFATYRAVKQNDFSTITVIASTKNGQLTDVKILSEGEDGKDLLTDAIKADWAKAILESGSASPDAITGASLKFSAVSVQEAMTEILGQISGKGTETPAEEKPEATEEAKAEETPAPEATEVPADQADSGNKDNGLAFGTYRAVKQNDFSVITVIASTKNGELTDVKILSEGEDGKDLLTDEIRENWAKAILESGSASPDVITGASLKFSAASVQEAMTEILGQISGKGTEAPAEEKPEEGKPEETPADQKEEMTPQPESGKDVLSLIALSMGREEENSYVTDYLEQDPYLVNIYEGYGFAKDYGSARGHYYTLTDVEKTQRPHAKANCLTCKTPDMHKMIEQQGVSVYSMPFDEVMAQMTQPISCYTCHGADDGNSGKMVVTHQYVNEALGENVSEIKAASLSCGQCHIEYYFTPEDSEAMMPYHSVAEMTPESILAYYDEMGFYDWEQPGTGTKMLKAQHPELETWSYGKHAAMLSCADCHMPLAETENGVQYHDHHLVSPLNSDTLLAKCAACHGSAENTIALVKDIQTKVTARETEVGNKLSALKDELTTAAADGRMNDEQLESVRKLHREAQWFFDFCYVENSEGAHNSELAYRCLDTAEAKIDEARGMIASAGTADVGTEAPAEAKPEVTEEPAPEITEEPAPEVTPEPETAAETPAKPAPAFAGYRAEAKNDFSKITVIACVKDGKLTDVKILSEGEEGKDLLTETIKEEWAKAILESGSASPDVITGATLTFSAGSVQEAMTEILDKAGIK